MCGLAGLAVVLYLALLVLLSLPIVQRMMAQRVASALADKFGCRVEVGSVRVDMPGMVTADSLLVCDKEGREMLRVGCRVGCREATCLCSAVSSVLYSYHFLLWPGILFTDKKQADYQQKREDGSRQKSGLDVVISVFREQSHHGWSQCSTHVSRQGKQCE